MNTAPPPSAAARPVVLVVDDAPDNLVVIGELLRKLYTVRVANSGASALRAAAGAPRPDLILLDVMMPDMSGHDVIRRLHAEPLTRDIPVIFVTAMDADENEEYGLALGAVDYVVKPVRPAILLARVRTQLELKRARDLLARHNDELEAEVARRSHENNLIKEISLQALAMLTATRDNETGNHLNRTRAYIEVLIDELQGHPRFAAQLSKRQCQLIAAAAPLHDIGKVGIPDRILLKPGALDAAEFEIMKRHAQIGADAIVEAIRTVVGPQWTPAASAGEEAPLAFLEVARQIAECHHERWDGKGYPNGLAGEAIPLPGRLMAIADVFDALASHRHYKAALPFTEVVEHIRSERGRHFDPDITDALLRRQDYFIDIAQRFADHA
ncbi:HD-GYP domain-containing protein [Pseudothauera lacus]|uniref:Two-component system response regulator n=1 Tax=Pseudothauera lacus TaxID=2136175 RepID=A0A2T4IES2_9RHOO|nr:HD domain-containing phosphohydrolase [Pseudothauera lacus]PTD96261.1 two-component system response regulator [Pseudothauera lacus]